MTPFRSRNPIPIAIAGITAIGLLLFGAFNAEALPIIGGGTVYHAAFVDAAGLRPGDEVRVAGVKVGKVDSIELNGQQVEIPSGSRTTRESAGTAAQTSGSRPCWGRSTSPSRRPGPASCPLTR